METASDQAPAVDATVPGAADEISIEERRRRVAELYPLGHSDLELAVRFAVSPTTIRSDRAAMGVEARPRGRTLHCERDEFVQRRRRVAELYARGHTEREIAEMLGVSSSTIMRDREAMNVAPRRRGPRIDDAEQARIAERRNRVRQRYDAGERSADVAIAENVSPYTVWRDLQATGKLRPAGQQVLYPEFVGPRECEYCGKEFQAKPSRVARGYGETCSHVCKGKRRMRLGLDRGVQALVENLPGWARRKIKRVWTGRAASPKGQRRGGRQRGYTEEVEARVRADYVPGKVGYGTLALRHGLSTEQVKTILGK